jgi:hypothetical protein
VRSSRAQEPAREENFAGMATSVTSHRYFRWVPSDRLALALEQLPTSDWRVFELFAAEYLAVEYPSLRTMASAGGDKGRDGELFLPDEEPTTAIQYSVTKDWDSKVKATLKRLADTMPSVDQLVYATPQVIGPAADDLKSMARVGYSVALDIRDRSWFLERELTHAQRQIAAEELARRYVDPLLSARGVKDKVAPVLGEQESRIALLHLSLDTEDRATDKGLTKSSFETLVRSVLHDTDADNRLELAAIQERVAGVLPAAEGAQVRALTKSAVDRLSRNRQSPVNHHRSTDDYCLSYPERLRTQERTARFIRDEEALENEIRDALAASGVEFASDKLCAETAARLRLAIEQVLLDRGEGFAQAVVAGEMPEFDPAELLHAASSHRGGRLSAITDEHAASMVYAVLERPTASTQSHLRRLADAYTLFAFLKQTPDVQRVVVRLFSDGDIWLDTSIILPLLGETLLLERTERHFTVLLRAALDAGLRLHVTDGVLEEVERHINKSVWYARTPISDWRARVPFLYAVYASAGHPRSGFANWASEFAGSVRPKEDVLDYLSEVFGIRQRDLKELSDQAPAELRIAVQEIWHEVHDRRRTRSGEELDQLTTLRLVAHDVENCVGVIMSRRSERSSPVGYRAWFLTLDRTAFTLTKELKERLGADAPASPTMSPDFLTEFLRLGPMRSALEAEARINLPLLTDISRYENTPRELIQLADEVRAANSDLPERLIQRKVRDAMDEARLRLGAQAHGGMRAAQVDLESAVANQSDMR